MVMDTSPATVADPTLELPTPIDGGVPDVAESQAVQAPVEPVAPSPSPQPALDVQMRQQMELMQQQREAELFAREQRLQEQENARYLQEIQAKLAAQLEQRYGMAPEHAAEQAALQAQIMYQSYQQHRRAQQQVQAERSKVQLATQLAQEHGVPVHVLMSATSPQEMQAMAQRQKAAAGLQAKVAALEAELAKVKRGQVPAQNFAGPVSAVPGNLSETDLEKAVAKGRVAMTPAISARLNKYWNS